jgi:multiple antibiotic resistance protein
MLGPIKIIAPFALMTKDATDEMCRKLAKAFAIASVTTLIAAAVGRAILDNWHVSSLAALLIAGGVILFLGSEAGAAAVCAGIGY